MNHRRLFTLHPGGRLASMAAGLALCCLLAPGLRATPSAAADKALAPATAAYLESLVGKYPDHTILNDPRLKPLLTATLGEKRFRQLLRGWGRKVDDVVVSPIEKIQDSIMLLACKPHDCLGYNATIYVDLKDGSVQACWRAESGEPAFDQWLSPGGAKALEDGECTRTKLEMRDI